MVLAGEVHDGDTVTVDRADDEGLVLAAGSISGASES
jgi:hypothetical protein